MRSRPMLVLACLVVPTLASAQRGGSGGRVRGDPRADWGSLNSSGGVQLSNRDVEDMSPIKLLIDKRKDLKLTDEQLKGLKDLEEKMKATNEPSFKALDSLRKEARPRSSSPSDEEMGRAMAARRAVPQVVATIRDNYASALKDAKALLNEAQQQPATELLDKQSQEAEKVLSEKLGGRRS